MAAIMAALMVWQKLPMAFHALGSMPYSNMLTPTYFWTPGNASKRALRSEAHMEPPAPNYGPL